MFGSDYHYLGRNSSWKWKNRAYFDSPRESEFCLPLYGHAVHRVSLDRACCTPLIYQYSHTTAQGEALTSNGQHRGAHRASSQLDRHRSAKQKLVRVKFRFVKWKWNERNSSPCFSCHEFRGLAFVVVLFLENYSLGLGLLEMCALERRQRQIGSGVFVLCVFFFQ